MILFKTILPEKHIFPLRFYQWQVFLFTAKKNLRTIAKTCHIIGYHKLYIWCKDYHNISKV